MDFKIWHEIHQISWWNLLDFIKFEICWIPWPWNPPDFIKSALDSTMKSTRIPSMKSALDSTMKSGRFHEILAKWAKDQWSYFLKSCQKHNKELRWSWRVHQCFFLFFFSNHRTLKFQQMQCNLTNKKTVALLHDWCQLWREKCRLVSIRCIFQ